jgi:2',5'-phosphodiesterase
MALRIVTYNVLAPSLGGPSTYTKCNPAFLVASFRLALVKKKLELEMGRDAVVALQEVELSWVGELHAFFARRGYHFVTANYEARRKGYMGVGLAFPLSRYDLLEASIAAVSDLKPLPPRAPAQGLLIRLLSPARALVTALLRWCGLAATPDATWEAVRARLNRVIAVRLQPRDASSKAFVVATYHMPCAFKLPRMMAAHAALAAQYVASFAASAPYVFVGDFNIVPVNVAGKSVTAPVYEMLTSGEAAPAVSPPLEFDDDAWRARVSPPLRSAYREALGHEPAFTNVGDKGDEPRFVDTLDYIFLSKEWAVKDVLQLPSLSDLAPGPQPTETEPSDHLLLAATLTLPAARN